MLPPLWEQAGEEYMMKQAILGLLSRLLMSMRDSGVELHALALPIIHETAKPDSPLALYLLTDALDLWSSVLQTTPTPENPGDIDPSLISLIEYLIPLLDHDAENIEKAVEITELYIRLTPTTMLNSEIFCAILRALEPKLGATKTGYNGYVTIIIEKALQQADLIGGVNGAQHTIVQGTVETDYFSFLARIGVSSPQLLIEALSASPAAQTLPEKLVLPSTTTGIDATLHWLLEEWFSHAEDVGDPLARKLMTIALTRLLELHPSWMLVRLQLLMSLWTSVLIELTDGDTARKVDCLVWTEEPSEQDESGVGESFQIFRPADWRRSAALEKSDPVRKVNLFELVHSSLRDCIERCGGEQAFQNDVLVNVDKEVVQAFVGLGIM
jgi:hypothetical protein